MKTNEEYTAVGVSLLNLLTIGFRSTGQTGMTPGKAPFTQGGNSTPGQGTTMSSVQNNTPYDSNLVNEHI